MRTHRIHKMWLIVSALVVGGFGPVFTLGTLASTSGFATWALDLLSWPLDGVQNYDGDTIRFLSALTGGFLLGWGVTILCLRAWAYDAAPEGVRRSLVVGACTWFLFDSAGSIASGNASNALFNIFFLALLVGPMWVPAKADAERDVRNAEALQSSGGVQVRN